MSVLDNLIETLVSDAQLEAGVPVEWLQARGMVARPAKIAQRRYSCPWSKEEDRFYLEHIEVMSYEEIAVKLGRTATAVKIHAKRRGFPLSSRVAGYLTANRAANLLGLDIHKVPAWMDAGIMPGELVPLSNRVMRRVKLLDFKLWLIKPETWIYIEANRIKNPSLRRLVQLAQERWGDEWWSTRQASEYLGCKTDDVQRQIALGKIRGTQGRLMSGRHLEQKWMYWYVRRSEIAGLRLNKGNGGPGTMRKEWSPRADAFILRARAEGRSYPEIGRMMRWPWQRVRYRYQLLQEQGETK